MAIGVSSDRFFIFLENISKSAPTKPVVLDTPTKPVSNILNEFIADDPIRNEAKAVAAKPIVPANFLKLLPLEAVDEFKRLSVRSPSSAKESRLRSALVKPVTSDLNPIVASEVIA